MKLLSMKPFQVSNMPSFKKFVIENPKEIDMSVLYEILKQDEFKTLGKSGDYAMVKDKNELHIVDLKGDTRDSFVLKPETSSIAEFSAKEAIEEIKNKRTNRIASFQENLVLDKKIKDAIKVINKNGCRLVLDPTKKIPKKDVLDFISSDGLAKVCEANPVIVNFGEKVHTSSKGPNTFHATFKLLDHRSIECKENVDVRFKTVDPEKITRNLNSKLATQESSAGLILKIAQAVESVNYECKNEEPALEIKKVSKTYLPEMLDMVSSPEMVKLCKKFPLSLELEDFGVNSSSCLVKLSSGENSYQIHYDSKDGLNKEKITNKFDANKIIEKWESETAERQKLLNAKIEMKKYIDENLKYFSK